MTRKIVFVGFLVVIGLTLTGCKIKNSSNTDDADSASVVQSGTALPNPPTPPVPEAPAE